MLIKKLWETLSLFGIKENNDKLGKHNPNVCLEQGFTISEGDAKVQQALTHAYTCLVRGAHTHTHTPAPLQTSQGSKEKMEGQCFPNFPLGAYAVSLSPSPNLHHDYLMDGQFRGPQAPWYLHGTQDTQVVCHNKAKAARGTCQHSCP